VLYLLPVAALLGAFGRRAAGGVLNQWTGRTDDHPLTGDLPTRLGFGACLGLCALMGGALWWQCLLMVPAVWVGTTLGSFGSVDMARGEGTFVHDWFGMSLVGLLSAFFPSVVAITPALFAHDPIGWRWLWIAGTTMSAPIVYWLGWSIGGAHGRQDFPVGLRGGMEISEALWGVVRGVGTLLAFA
jgi:hypothetical protein